MGFTAKDGSRFTNHSTYKQHEARIGSKIGGKMAGMVSSPMAGGGSGAADGGEPMDGMDDQAQDGAALAVQHGPATEVSVHHDHDAGKHSVHAEHPDGHAHDTEHASADDAHKFAADCAGCGGGGGEVEPGGEGDGGMGTGE